MRASLAQQGLRDARTVSSMKNGLNIRYAGLVICRQRPGTAGGVVFITLEDETGFVEEARARHYLRRECASMAPIGAGFLKSL